MNGAVGELDPNPLSLKRFGGNGENLIEILTHGGETSFGSCPSSSRSQLTTSSARCSRSHGRTRVSTRRGSPTLDHPSPERELRPVLCVPNMAMRWWVVFEV